MPAMRLLAPSKLLQAPARPAQDQAASGTAHLADMGMQAWIGDMMAI
jgi:hypothetical protein